MPRPYRLVPVSVEAIQLTPLTAHRAAIWSGGIEVEEIDAEDSTKRFIGLNIPTISGVHRANEGDYIVRDTEGNFSVMSEREFVHKYEQI